MSLDPDLLAWADPPATANRRGMRAAFVDELKANPGRWAQYRPGHPHTLGAGDPFKRKYGCEYTARGRGDGTYDVYVRWTGGLEVEGDA